MSKIYFFSNTYSSRLQYIVEELLQRFLGFEIVFLTKEEDLIHCDGIKINYSERRITEKEIHIFPHGLLFEHGIQPQAKLEKSINEAVLNQSINDLDVFAASFYLLSRYEEYLPFEVDAHQRFSAKNSLAYRCNFLHRPIIQEWCNILKNNILQLFEIENYTYPHTYCYQPTFDIDQAFSFKNKGLGRTAAGLLKDFFNLKRWRVLFGFEKDPFDVFDFLANIHENHTPIYFFLLGDWGKFDKNISVENVDFQSIIHNVCAKNRVGIHPSYQSNGDFFQLKKEIARLEKVGKKQVTRSRQHFLKLRFPSTYQQLIKAGIEEDYTMGYADAVGFRASTALPFRWYDIENEEVGNLIIHSFQVMDVTLKDYLKLSTEEAIATAEQLKAAIKAVNGEFVTLWHNSSFDDSWEGWQEVYVKLSMNNES